MGIFGNTFSGWHLLVIVFLVLLLFGAPKLPGLARSIGQSMKIFRSEIKTDKGGDKNATATETPAPPTVVSTTESAPVANSDIPPKP